MSSRQDTVPDARAAVPARERPDQVPAARPRHLLLPLAALLALATAIASGAREYATSRALFAAQREAEVEAVTAKLRDHLAARETLARSVSAVFLPPAEGIRTGALRDVDPDLLSFVPDIVSFVWIPRVEAGQLGAVYSALEAAGVAEPAILGPGRAPLTEAELEPPLFVVLDILPATEQNRLSLGLNLGALPRPREALARAEAEGDIAATAPLELVQLPGVKALVLYVPIAKDDTSNGSAIGYLGFSFRFDTLFGSALDGVDVPGAVRISDVSGTPTEVFASGTWDAADLVLSRDLQFGGRLLQVDFAAPSGAGAALARGSVAGGLVLLAFGAILLAARHLRRTSLRLEEALAAQVDAEERLRVLVGELTHRIKNVYAVASSVASQTFAEIDPEGTARSAFTGRLQSLAGATALVTEGGGEASLKPLIRALGLPFAERVVVRGPDLEVSAQAAQSLALVVHELWTNAAKHGALAAPEGRVELGWRVSGGSFQLEWAERDGPALAALPERHGFGRRLLERLVPSQLGGTGRLAAAPSGVTYALEVPVGNVLAAPAGAPADPGA